MYPSCIHGYPSVSMGIHVFRDIYSFELMIVHSICLSSTLSFMSISANEMLNWPFRRRCCQSCGNMKIGF